MLPLSSSDLFFGHMLTNLREGQKIRHRNPPKGYAEMLERQHNQMVLGLQELYYRLLKASLWEGEPLDVSTGRPLTHDILASLNLLDDQGDDDEAKFIENPRLSLMLERNEHNGSGRKTSTNSIQGSPRVALHKPAMSFDSQLQEEIGKSRSPSYGPSPTIPTLHHPHEQAGLHSNDVRNSPIESLPEVPRSFQPDILWTDTSNSYDTSQVSPSQTSSFCSTNWPFSAAFMLPSSQTQLPMSCSSDMLDCKPLACAACPLLHKSWFDNSVGVDNIESMSSPTG